MPKKEYHSFYKGISGDDYIAQPGEYLWGKNIDGSRTGYGITLGPKVHKKLVTQVPISDISNINSYDETDIYMVGHNSTDTGYVYNMESSDNVPTKTITVSDTDYFYLKRTIEFNDDFWVIATEGVSSANTEVHLFETEIDGDHTETYDVLDDNSLSLTNNYIPPYIEFGGSLYLGGRGSIIRITPSGSSYSYTNFSFSGLSDIVGITIHNTILYVYDRLGEVRYWKGSESITEGQNKYPFSIQRVVSQGEYDIATTVDGELVAVGGAAGTDVSSCRQSKFLETYGEYEYIKDFSLGSRTDVSETISASGYGNFVIGEGKSIYKFGSLFPGISPSFHNICSENNLGEEIERIYSLSYQVETQMLYFSYSTSDSYGVDYIDLSSMETCKDGILYFNVHRGVPDAVNQIVSHFFTTSETNDTASLGIYIRINNGSWELIRSVNEATKVITRGKNEAIKNKFIDCQIKAVFNNEDMDEFPPILHSITQKYKVTESQ